jgi:hypothetical protein
MATQKIVRNAKSGKFAKTKKSKSAPASHVTETVTIKKKKLKPIGISKKKK